VDVNAAGQSDRLVVGFGTLNLTGAVLDVMAAAGKYAPSTSYLIIDNSTGSDAVTGTFASLNSSLAFLTPTVSTTGGDGNDVVLTLTRNATVFRDVAITPNQAAVAGALDQGPIDSPLVLALLDQTEPGARQAFDALSGEVHATVAGVLVNDSHFVRDAVLARLVQAHHANGGAMSFAAPGATGPTAVAASEGAAKMSLGMGSGELAAPARGSSLAFWSQGFGSWGSFDGDGNAAAADRTLGGFVSGVDGYVGGGWRAGIAAGYTQSDTSVDARLSAADIESYHLAAYAGGRLGAFALRAGAAWAWHDVKTKRTIAFPGFLERAEASYDGDTGQVFGELALPFVAGKSALEPFAGLAYVHASTDGFTEDGGIAALTSRGTDQDVGYARLGLRAAATMTFGGMHVVPYASAAWLHAFSDVTPDVALAFASPAAGFTISSAPVARDSALLEAGVAMHLAPGATVAISYQGQLGTDVEDHGVSGRLHWQF
jgi:outer membrane autotransporter protein